MVSVYQQREIQSSMTLKQNWKQKLWGLCCVWHKLVEIKACHTAAFLLCMLLISVLAVLPGRRSQRAAGAWQTFHFNGIISTCHKMSQLPLISCISILCSCIYIHTYTPYICIYINIFPAIPLQAGFPSPCKGLQMCLKFSTHQGSWQTQTEVEGIQVKTWDRRHLKEPAWALTSVQHREVTINHYSVAQIAGYS